jgi:hypothetical protein
VEKEKTEYGDMIFDLQACIERNEELLHDTTATSAALEQGEFLCGLNQAGCLIGGA